MWCKDDLLKKFLSIPYKHAGRGFDGADCYGGIKLWYDQFLNIEIWDIEEDYPEDWRWKGKAYFINNYHREWQKVITPKRHDVILFRLGSEINHAGIYLGSGKFFHVCRAGGVIAQLGDRRWQSRLEGYYRLKSHNEDHH